jgi:hypothetical protein
LQPDSDAEEAEEGVKAGGRVVSKVDALRSHTRTTLPADFDRACRPPSRKPIVSMVFPFDATSYTKLHSGPCGASGVNVQMCTFLMPRPQAKTYLQEGELRRRTTAPKPRNFGSRWLDVDMRFS